MEDKIEHIGKGSLIQHGKFNDRIYLMSLKKEDCPDILHALRGMARENKYTKIFCKIPGWAAPYFFSDGYITEAYIPLFFKGKEPAFFVSKFLDSDRLMEVEYASLIELGKQLRNRPREEKIPSSLPKKLSIRELKSTDVDQITEIYRTVFASYPFPIHNPGYIHKTMKGNVRYFGAEKKGKLVAVSSAELDRKNKNAEMTDFATMPDFRGLKLAQILLSRMEKEVRKDGIRTLYTIARLNSPAMNRTFLKLNYQYGGTLIRNTNIAGNVESMNIYYKTL